MMAISADTDTDTDTAADFSTLDIVIKVFPIFRVTDNVANICGDEFANLDGIYFKWAALQDNRLGFIYKI